jgi:hypothetical protein
MKPSLAFLVLPMVLLVGCGDKAGQPSATTNGPSSGSALTAPVDYLKSATDAQHRAVKTVDTVALNQAVDLFQVQEGRLPKDLNELVAKNYIRQIPTPPAGSKIVYNGSTGKVTVEKL